VKRRDGTSDPRAERFRVGGSSAGRRRALAGKPRADRSLGGRSFDDTTAGGESKAHPQEWDLVGGLQLLVLENVKLIGEYRHHDFDDRITAGRSTLRDDGFTVRMMTGS
jgi:hypothetical protein